MSLALMGSAAAAPLEAYGKLPSIEQALVSPDGGRIALVVTNGSERRVAVQSMANNSLQAVIDAGDQKLRDIRWAGPDHLLLTVSTTTSVLFVDAPRTEWRTVVDVNLAKKTRHQLLTDAKDSMSVIVDTPAVRIVNGKPYVFVEGVQFINNQGVPSLFRIDLDSDRSIVARQAGSRTDQWLVDSTGAPVAETEFDPDAGHWVLKVDRGGNWRVAETEDDKIDHSELLGLGRDGRSVLVSARDGKSEAVREVAADAVEPGPPKLPQQDQGLIFDPVTEALIGTHQLIGDEERYVFFDPTDQAAWAAVTAALPGRQVSLASIYEDPDSAVALASISADHKRFMVVADSPTEGPSYYLVNAADGSARDIGQIYGALNPQDIGERRPVSFKAADGLAISGYLTLPHGRDPKGLPLVVFPHGGPAARDAPGFDWWAEAMASHGYAVLQVNYRGSDGYGDDFLEAGFGEWGRKMQTDVSDGVRYLAAQGVIDPKRVCIVGASYGGYAALAGVAFQPGVYRCAVDVAGLSELRSFVAWAQNRSDATTGRYWARYMGASGPKDPHLDDLSPADHADRITAPVLLIHGKDDTVVPFEQTQTMYDALKRAGKDASLVILDHEDHWLSRGETRLQMLQATVDFLEKNNPPT
ncbi:MAG TPA: S9 family peptidase [Caulobacteraceae bacterium]|nr:S9 family peptidase [Caulobacteraceae bacterium]